MSLVAATIMEHGESGRFRGVWRLRLMRAVTVRLLGLSLQSPTGTPSRTTDPPESPALHHWVQILTDTPKEILYAAADAERISDYILTIEQKKEIRHTQEVGVMRKDIPYAERTYLVVSYVERNEAKALGARWDAVKKAWYVGPEAVHEKIAKWEPQHQPAPTLDPRAEFAAVLREIGGVVQGEHPIMNGEAQRIPAV